MDSDSSRIFKIIKINHQYIVISANLYSKSEQILIHFTMIYNDGRSASGNGRHPYCSAIFYPLNSAFGTLAR